MNFSGLGLACKGPIFTSVLVKDCPTARFNRQPSSPKKLLIMFKGGKRHAETSCTGRSIGRPPAKTYVKYDPIEDSTEEAEMMPMPRPRVSAEESTEAVMMTTPMPKPGLASSGPMPTAAPESWSAGPWPDAYAAMDIDVGEKWVIEINGNEYTIDGLMSKGHYSDCLYASRQPPMGGEDEHFIVKEMHQDNLLNGAEDAYRMSFFHLLPKHANLLNYADSDLIHGAYSFIDGLNIIEYANKHWFGQEHIVALCRDMGAALRAIFLAGLTHGDVRPDNILFSPTKGVFVLADYTFVANVNTKNKVSTVLPMYRRPGNERPKEGFFFQTMSKDAYALAISILYMASDFDFAIQPTSGLGITADFKNHVSHRMSHEFAKEVLITTILGYTKEADDSWGAHLGNAEFNSNDNIRALKFVEDMRAVRQFPEMTAFETVQAMSKYAEKNVAIGADKENIPVIGRTLRQDAQHMQEGYINDLATVENLTAYVRAVAGDTDVIMPPTLDLERVADYEYVEFVNIVSTWFFDVNAVKDQYADALDRGLKKMAAM